MEHATGAQSQTSWHSLSTENSLERLGTSTDGLSHTEATKRLADYGPNCLPESAGAVIVHRFDDSDGYRRVLLVSGDRDYHVVDAVIHPGLAQAGLSLTPASAKLAMPA